MSYPQVTYLAPQLPTADDFRAIFDEAIRLGQEAGEKAKPVPVSWIQVDILDEPLPGAKPSFDAEGVCGFAWITFKGTIPFSRWLKKNGYGGAGYPKGYQLSANVIIGGFYTQSMARKEAAARAMAAHFKASGIDCYVQSRLD